MTQDVGGMRVTGLAEGVHKWIAKHGYPLEMRIAKQLLGHGWKVHQGPYFLDKSLEGARARETDISASRWKDYAPPSPHEGGWMELTVELVVECKVARDRPWVAFIAAQQEHPLMRAAGWFTNDSGRIFNRASMQADFVRSKLYGHEIPSAYKIVQMNENGKDHAYEAVMSVAKAARAFSSTEGEDDHLPRIAFPVVLIDGSIVAASLSEDGEVVTREVESVVLRLRHPDLNSHMTNVHVVTEHGFAEWLVEATRAADSLVEAAIAIQDRAVKAGRKWSD